MGWSTFAPWGFALVSAAGLANLLHSARPSLHLGAPVHIAAAHAAEAPRHDQSPPGAPIELELVVGGLASPLYVTHARDESHRLFIVEQAGAVHVLQPGATVPSLFLDITTRVLAGGERGLLGLAFHPQFRDNRRFFVNYTRQPDGATVIAEYRVSESNPNLAEPNESVLLTVAQPFANHNGGMIEFGPDGLLYIGMGDGGSSNDPNNRAQNPDELLGKILRIDPDHPQGPSLPYSSPSGNPFFGGVPGRDEIFALGFRNPWRFSFDRGTGQLFAADVGQNAREEIDIVTLGGNYGWRIFEGTHCTELGPASCTAAGFIPPIADYAQTGGRCAVTGGYVYRGSRSSLPLGTYVYGDFCTGEIFSLEGGAQDLLLDTDLSISSFGEDEAGEIYVVGLGGTVHRIVNPMASADDPPAAVTLNGVTFRTGQTIVYQATVAPGSLLVPVDIYLGALLADGVTFLSLVQVSPDIIAATFGPSPIPFLSNTSLSQPTVIPFSYAFLGSEPAGTYFTYAGLAVSGSDPLEPANQLSLAVREFQFSP